ncbi:MAG: hypothetical protein ACYC6A_21560 [Armatimonadota bacterium]
MADFFKRMAGLPHVGTVVRDLLNAAFHHITGHSHSGAAGDGGPIILPTSDPHIAGALWNDGGTITISAG